MNYIDHDLTGFVNFPHPSTKLIKPVDTGLTHVYLISFDDNYEQMTQSINQIGNFCGDDVSPKQYNPFKNSLEETIENLKNTKVISKEFYFGDSDKFKVISSILIGWSKYSYEHIDKIDPWCCTFRDLSQEGRKMYYSMKKLHNDSEIRILTFNNIK